MQAKSTKEMHNVTTTLDEDIAQANRLQTDRNRHEIAIQSAADSIREGINPLVAALALGQRLGRRVNTADLTELAEALHGQENAEDAVELSHWNQVHDDTVNRILRQSAVTR